MAFAANELEQILNAHDIGPQEPFTVDNAVIDVRLRGEIKHIVHIIKMIHFRNVGLMKFKERALVKFLQPFRPRGIGMLIDSPNPPALSQTKTREMTPYKS